MKKLNSREIVILFIAVGLLAVFFSRQAIVGLLPGNAGDIETQTDLLRKRLSKAEKTAAQGADVQRRYESLAESIGTASSVSEERSSLVSRVEAAAAEAGISITNMRPRQSRSSSMMQFFPVEVQVNGQWAGIVKFFHLMQETPNLCFIDEFNLTKNSDGSMGGELVLSRMRLKP